MIHARGSTISEKVSSTRKHTDAAHTKWYTQKQYMSYNAREVCGGIQLRGEAKQFVEDTNQNHFKAHSQRS